MTSALEGGEWSAARHGRNLPPRKDRVPILQEAGWAPGPVGTSVENLDPTGFNPRTVQPGASRYTDWATRPEYQYVPVAYVTTRCKIWL
jgi:hypothetical protein